MKFEYDLTKQDLYEFYKFNSWYSPDLKTYRIKSRLWYGFYGFATPLVISYFDQVPFNVTAMTINIIWGSFLFFIGFFFTKQFKLGKVIKAVENILIAGKNQDLLGIKILVVKDNLIETKTENSECTIKFKIIEKIRQDDSYYYIYTNVFSAYIIPRYAFQSETQEMEFNQIFKSAGIDAIPAF